MTKNEFLKRLGRALRRVKREEREKSLAFYREMIDDRVESGLSEAEAVEQMEPIEQIAAGILQDAATRGMLKKARNPVVIVLLIIGSPLWVSLLAVLFAVMAVITACLWIVVACLYGVMASLFAASLAGIIGGIVFLGYPMAAVMLFAASLLCCGVGILTLLFANLTVRGFAHATGWMWRSVCRLLFKRRNVA